tara:strand:+ start:14777 stop:15346 length:570 start_codon:yes stop_codon:yes gene_type:complete
MSERDLTPEMLAAIAAKEVRPLLLVKAFFPAGTVRVWTGVGDLIYASETWNGLGSLLSIDAVQEQIDGTAQGLRIQLSGLDSAFFSPVLLGDYQNSRAEVYFGVRSPDGTLSGAPLLLFAGKLDSDETEDDGESSTLSINVESRLADLLRPRERRYTHQDQQALNPGAGDEGLRFIPGLQNLDLKWGSV